MLKQDACFNQVVFFLVTLIGLVWFGFGSCIFVCICKVIAASKAAKDQALSQNITPTIASTTTTAITATSTTTTTTTTLLLRLRVELCRRMWRSRRRRPTATTTSATTTLTTRRTRTTTTTTTTPTTKTTTTTTTTVVSRAVALCFSCVLVVLCILNDHLSCVEWHSC